MSDDLVRERCDDFNAKIAKTPPAIKTEAYIHEKLAQFWRKNIQDLAFMQGYVSYIERLIQQKSEYPQALIYHPNTVLKYAEHLPAKIVDQLHLLQAKISKKNAPQVLQHYLAI